MSVDYDAVSGYGVNADKLIDAIKKHKGFILEEYEDDKVYYLEGVFSSAYCEVYGSEYEEEEYAFLVCEDDYRKLPDAVDRFISEVKEELDFDLKPEDFTFFSEIHIW